MSRLSSHDLISPRLQLRGRFSAMVWFWTGSICVLISGSGRLVLGEARRGCGEPAVRVSAAGQGAAAAGLRRRSAELLGAQGRRLHRRDQVASPSLL